MTTAIAEFEWFGSDEEEDAANWYFSRQWQEMEADADRCLAERRYEEYDNMDDFIGSL